MKYESENEVDTFFVRDLLEQLGYDFKDIAMQHPIKIKAGRGYSTIKPDFGIFDGSARDRKHALLVVESKLKKMTQNDVNQAKSYTELLKTPYCMMTNGKTIYIYKNNYPKFDKYMKFNVSELKNNWKKLYRSISKEAIKALK